MSEVATFIGDMRPPTTDLEDELLRRLTLLFRTRRRHQKTAEPASVSAEVEALRRSVQSRLLRQRIHEYPDHRKDHDTEEFVNSAVVLANWALGYDPCTRVAGAFGVEYLNDELDSYRLLGELGEDPPPMWRAGSPVDQHSAIPTTELVEVKGNPRDSYRSAWDPLRPPNTSIESISDELRELPYCPRIVCLDCGVARFAQKLSASCPAATIENFSRCTLPSEEMAPHYDYVILNLPNRDHVGLAKALQEFPSLDRFVVQTLVERYSRPSHEDWEGRVPYAATLLKPRGFLILLAGRKAYHGPAFPRHAGLTLCPLKGQSSPDAIWLSGSSPTTSGPLGLPLGSGRILSKWGL